MYICLVVLYKDTHNVRLTKKIPHFFRVFAFQPLKTLIMNDIEIKKIRKDLKMSQKGFAKILGVGERAVQTWESGERNISQSALLLLKMILKESEQSVSFKNTSDNDIDYKEEVVKGLVARVKLLEKSVDTLNTALLVQSGIFQKEVSVNRSKKIDPEIFNSVKHFYKNDLSKFDIEDLKKTYVFLSDEVVLEQTSLYETAYKTE